MQTKLDAHQAPRAADLSFVSLSFTPTDAGCTTPADLARALRDNDRELLSRAWLRKNRRHPLALP